MPSWNFTWEDKMKLCFWNFLWHDRSSTTSTITRHTSIAHARGKHSKVMQCNHKALGKGRAWGSPHLLCLWYCTLQGISPGLGWGRTQRLQEPGTVQRCLAVHWKAAVHKDGDTAGITSRDGWPHSFRPIWMPPALPPIHCWTPKYSSEERLQQYKPAESVTDWLT